MRYECLRKLLRVNLILLLSVLTITMSNPVYAANTGVASPKFVLTDKEKAYLQTLQNRTITIAYSYDLVQNELGGKSSGLLDPVLNILENEFGLTVSTLKTSWKDAFTKIEDGSVDFYGPVALSDSRRKQYITVDPFYRSYSKIITRVKDPVHSTIGLYNRSIGLLEGSIMAKTMQAYVGPNGKIIYFSNMNDMISGLTYGIIDAFATLDNAELEILRNNDIQFEFSVDNFFADQGLISGQEDMKPLASLLDRYLEYNPKITDEVLNVRHDVLLQNARETLANEISYLKANYDEIVIYSDRVLYPLCYEEDDTTKGMQVQINETFEELTGIKIRFDDDKNYPRGLLTATEKLKTGECMAFIGANLDIATWNNPSIEYSPLLWMDTLRLYSDRPLDGELHGKTIGAMSFSSDYLGWNSTTGNVPILFYNRSELLTSLKKGTLDAVFMEEMRFNYSYSILKDHGLREIGSISTEAPTHILYGAQNKEFNRVFNQAIELFRIVNPQEEGQWKAQSVKYKSDYIRSRIEQQNRTMVMAVVFIIMLATLFYMFIQNRRAYMKTQKILDEAKENQETIIESINYASKIQKNLLPNANSFRDVFSDYHIIWKPRDVVGGDIYWIKTFEKGTVLCVCDCTGHGTPGALLTMLVVSALETVVKASNCSDTADIIWQLEQKLVTVLSTKSVEKKNDSNIKDGCDLAVLFIADDKSVTLSAGNTNVFVCDGNEVQRIKGQRIYVGEGKLTSKGDIKTVSIPANPGNKFYIASDGLFDQPGGDQSAPFGYKRFGKIILKSHSKKQSLISRDVWDAFEAYMGTEQRVDDFEMITFKP